MSSVNKAIIIGNLGRDPEMRTFPDGTASCNLAVATTDRWKDKQTGEMKEATEWHRVSVAGRLAEICGQYLRKGSQVYIEGSLRTRKWTDKDGVERYTTEIRADQMRMLGARQDGQQGGNGHDQGQAPAPRQQSAPRQQQRAPAPAPANSSSGFDDMDSDIPFRDPASYRGAHLVL